MTRQEWQIGLIGLLGGIVVTILFQTVAFTNSHKNMGMNGMMGGDRRVGMNLGMDDMTSDLMGKKGDDFDRAFITNMIMHHQGAIEMAEEAKKSAQHEEIKKLADAIIVAQAKEIEDMRQWYKNWYGSDAPEYRMGMMHY